VNDANGTIISSGPQCAHSNILKRIPRNHHGLSAAIPGLTIPGNTDQSWNEKAPDRKTAGRFQIY